MKFTNVLTYDAPAPAVHAMVTDPAFQELRSQAGTPQEHSATVTADGQGARIEVMRLLAVELPGILAKLTGNRIRIHEVQTWPALPPGAADCTGHLAVTIAGHGGGVDGRLSMAETAGQTRIDLDAQIKVHIPLVGGKVENSIAEMLGKFLTKEQELGSAWLRGQRPS